MKRRYLFVPLALLALAPGMAAFAEPPAAKLVADKSQIVFVSKQMGVPVEGTFKKFDAQVAFDPKKPEGGSVALRIDTASAGFGIPMSDAELPKAPWFDAAHFPQATFQSSSVKALGGGRFDVAGKLSVKGSSRDVVVPLTLSQSGGKTIATGAFVIKRLDFRIGDGEWKDTSMVANDVQVRFRLSLTGVPAL